VSPVFSGATQCVRQRRLLYLRRYGRTRQYITYLQSKAPALHHGSMSGVHVELDADRYRAKVSTALSDCTSNAVQR
jgi:hypothetical protein